MATAKPEAKEAKEPKEAAAPAPERPAAGPPAARGGLKAWLPAAAIVVVAPAASWAVNQFVLLPRLEKKLVDPKALAAASASDAGATAESGHNSKAPAAPPTTEFKDIVVNLAGTMGTRYLKTTFTVTGTDADFAKIMEDNRMRLKDVTINVLSALTLSDLEEPGSKNVLREKLISAYNQALGRKLCDQVYFSDFVVQ